MTIQLSALKKLLLGCQSQGTKSLQANNSQCSYLCLRSLLASVRNHYMEIQIHYTFAGLTKCFGSFCCFVFTIIFSLFHLSIITFKMYSSSTVPPQYIYSLYTVAKFVSKKSRPTTILYCFQRTTEKLALFRIKIYLRIYEIVKNINDI